jgi:hypothetical protein
MVPDRRGVESVEHLPHLGVHGGDLAVVLRDVPSERLARHRPLPRGPTVKALHRAEPRTPGGLGVEEGLVPRGGWLVGSVGIHVVEPQEERTLGVASAR